MACGLALSLVAAAARGSGAPAPAEPAAEVVEQPGGLTAAALAAAAVDSSAVLAGHRAQTEAAVAGVNEALAALVPRLNLVARHARLSSIANASLGNVVVAQQPSPTRPLPAQAPLFAVPLALPSFTAQTVFQVGLVVPLLDYLWRLPAFVAAAEGGAAAARLAARAACLQARVDAQLLYYAWVRAQLQGKVAAASARQAQQHRQLADNLLAAGAASRADVEQLAAQQARAALFAARADGLTAVLLGQVRTALHAAVEAPLRVGEAVDAVLPPVPLPDSAVLVQRAMARRLELQALAAGLAAQQAEARAARAAALPRLDLFADLAVADPNPRYVPPVGGLRPSWDAGVQLSWALHEVPTALAQGHGRAGHAEALAAQRAALADALRGEVIEAAEGLRQADTAAQLTAAGLAAADAAYRVRRDQFAGGQTSAIAIVDADSDLTRARLDSLGARIEQRIGRLKLAHATGEDVAP